MFHPNRIAKSGLLFIAALSLAVITNCGGSNKQAQAPESMIRDFVGKHHVMVDESLASLYVTEEQAEVNKAIALSTEEKKQAGRVAGASGWIVKPFKPEQLLKVVKMVIGE